jgi:hypothetical protein
LPPSDAQGNTPPIQPPAGDDAQAHEFARQALIDQLRRKYGQNIENPYWQVKLLEYLTTLIKQQHPDDWRTRVETLLKDAFPDQAQILLARLDALETYFAWMESLEHDMRFEDDVARRKAIRDKRLELFGEDAYIIWEAQFKDDQFGEKMNALSGSTDSFSDKVDSYVAIIEDVFGSQVLKAEGAHKTQIMGKFMSLPNVQSDLRGMSPEDRKQSMRDFRAAIGLDEAALNRWEALDTERDNEWSAGIRYMQERKALETQNSGQLPEAALRDLQDRVFGKEQSQYIRNEEATGYFRYAGERTYQ